MKTYEFLRKSVKIITHLNANKSWTPQDNFFLYVGA